MPAADDLECFFDHRDFAPRYVTRYGIAKFRTLLAQVSDPDVSEGDGRTALFLAARAGRYEHLLALLEAKADPNCCDAADEAPLQVASRYGHLDCVRALLAAGADVNHLPSPKKTKYAETALCSAVRKERIDVVHELLAAGANPNRFAKGEFFEAPLLCAAWAGNIELCEILLAKGANPILYPGKSHRIPLHDAIAEGHIDVVKLLLKHGADPNSRDNNDDTAVMTALKVESRGFDPMPVLFALLEAKVDLNLENKMRETALSMALELRLTEAAELLRKSGARELPVDDNESQGEEIAPGVTIGYSLVSRKWVEPTKADDELTKRLLTTAPRIVNSRGWESSPKHWRILFIASEPLTIDRIAYVVRGSFNAPKGRELADGPHHLGEGYEAAANRFVEQGLLEKLGVPDAAARNSTTEEVQKILKRLGQRVGGNKSELMLRLASVSPTDIEALARKRDWFVRTKKGTEAIEGLTKGEPMFQWKTDRPDLIDLIFDSFLKRNLEAGLLTFLEWVSSQGRTRRLESTTVRDIRGILDLPVSENMVFEPKEEAAIRAGAAVVELVGNRMGDHGLDNWKRWGIKFPPRWPEDEVNGVTIHLPSEFAFHLLHQDAE